SHPDDPPTGGFRMTLLIKTTFPGTGKILKSLACLRAGFALQDDRNFKNTCNAYKDNLMTMELQLN
ncbi:hypothetical protein AC481_07000, partial [miscellaneous Crenarchaeota group archaeon SMTZ-80]